MWRLAPPPTPTADEPVADCARDMASTAAANRESRPSTSVQMCSAAAKPSDVALPLGAPAVRRRPASPNEVAVDTPDAGPPSAVDRMDDSAAVARPKAASLASMSASSRRASFPRPSHEVAIRATGAGAPRQYRLPQATWTTKAGPQVGTIKTKQKRGRGGKRERTGWRVRSARRLATDGARVANTQALVYLPYLNIGLG